MSKVKAPVIPRTKKKTEENIITLEDIKEQFQPGDYVILFIDSYKTFYAKIVEIFAEGDMATSVTSNKIKSNVIIKIVPFLNFQSDKLDLKENNSNLVIRYIDCSFISKTSKEAIIKNMSDQYLENIKNAKEKIKTLRKDIQTYQYNLRELKKIK